MLRRTFAPVGLAVLAAVLAAPAIAQPYHPNLEIRVANTAPPRARHERRQARPDRDSVWQKGYWSWEGSRWSWIEGRWEIQLIGATAG